VYSKGQGGPSRIFVIGRDGSNEHALTNPTGDGDYHPIWQPMPDAGRT
jgi:hypothetical protein